MNNPNNDLLLGFMAFLDNEEDAQLTDEKIDELFSNPDFDITSEWLRSLIDSTDDGGWGKHNAAKGRIVNKFEQFLTSATSTGFITDRLDQDNAQQVIEILAFKVKSTVFHAMDLIANGNSDAEVAKYFEIAFASVYQSIEREVAARKTPSVKPTF